MVELLWRDNIAQDKQWQRDDITQRLRTPLIQPEPDVVSQASSLYMHFTTSPLNSAALLPGFLCLVFPSYLPHVFPISFFPLGSSSLPGPLGPLYERSDSFLLDGRELKRSCVEELSGGRHAGGECHDGSQSRSPLCEGGDQGFRGTFGIKCRTDSKDRSLITTAASLVPYQQQEERWLVGLRANRRTAELTTPGLGLNLKPFWEEAAILQHAHHDACSTLTLY